MQEAAWLNQLLADALCKCFYCKGTLCFRACTEDAALLSQVRALERPDAGVLARNPEFRGPAVAR